MPEPLCDSAGLASAIVTMTGRTILIGDTYRHQRLAYYFGSVHPLPPPTIKAERGGRILLFLTESRARLLVAAA